MAQDQSCFTVPLEESGVRFDVYCAKVLQKSFSRTKIKTLIELGSIRLNDKAVKSHAKISTGDVVTVAMPEEAPVPERGEAIAISVLYEDRDLIVVDKPAGMVVHPGCGNLNGTLVNALIYHSSSLSSIGDEQNRPGIVHRLDKDTSGVLVVAKNDSAHRILAEQFKTHEVKRAYWVIVKGIVQHDEMRSEEPLGRSLVNRKVVVIRHDDGKESVTNFRVIERFKKTTFLEARPETGRTHQIRVHLKGLGYPVLGDLTYGVASPFISRQALHARELGFRHPTSGKNLLFCSELPKDMIHLLESIKK